MSYELYDDRCFLQNEALLRCCIGLVGTCRRLGAGQKERGSGSLVNAHFFG